jgi:hypothetical protein
MVGSAVRPLLLLDVDGVLNAFGAFAPTRGAGGLSLPDHLVLRVVNGYELALNPVHVDWLRTLESDFDIVWTTMWTHRAPSDLAPVLGIGADWPYVDFARYHDEALLDRWGAGVGHYKFPGVLALGGNKPLVWVDDDLHADHFDWAADRDASGTPTMLIQPSPATGWVEAEYREILEFGERVRGA